MKDWNPGNPWFHGSPLELKVLRRGSTITQDRDLARIFSHKPTIVSISGRSIKHDGKIPGFLYQIAEHLQPADIYPHPRSSMEEGKEWLTKRELRVVLIGPTQIVEQEKLTEREAARLRELARPKENALSRHKHVA